MRKKIVAGNWKMNTTLPEALSLAKELKSASIPPDVTVIISPPYPFLYPVNEVKGEKVKLAAQNCYCEEKGAFTGEVSAEMLKSLAVNYVIIGHSERRNFFREDNYELKKKINHALKNNLTPIYCIGESLEQRETNSHFEIITSQLEEVLFELDIQQIKKIIIAYEPVWAIGTGQTASPQQAQEIHKFIRKTISEKFGADSAESISILYGGSCNAKNASELFALADVDGGLIGGASLVAESFIQIINSFPKGK